MPEQGDQPLPHWPTSVTWVLGLERRDRVARRGDSAISVNTAHHQEGNDRAHANRNSVIATITDSQQDHQDALDHPGVVEELEPAHLESGGARAQTGMLSAAQTVIEEASHDNGSETEDLGNADNADPDAVQVDAVVEGSNHASAPRQPIVVRPTNLSWTRRFGFNPNRNYYLFGPEMPCVTRTTPIDRPSDKECVYDSSAESSNYWPIIERHLANPTGGDLRVFCPICVKSELVIDQLQPPNVMVIQEDPHVLTPCGHVVGYHC